MLVIPCDCGCNSDNYDRLEVREFPVPAKRDFRTRMKRQTPRKQTAGQRIAMNRFWNELEEVFNRLEDVRLEAGVETLEEAENVLNETLECDREVETLLAGGLSLQNSCWCQKGEVILDKEEDDGDVSGYSSHFEDEEEEEEDEESGAEDDSLLTSPCSYFSFEADLPLPPPLDQTLSSLCSDWSM